MRPINRALLGLSRRAERASAAQLVASFVDVGSLSASVANNDHQVIYGRRGTGKTHVLAILFADARDRGDVPVQIDLRTLGSTGGIYSDPSLPVSERATRLLTDLLWAIHDGIMERALESETTDLAALQPRIDAFRESISSVQVVGQAVHTSTASQSSSTRTSSGLDVSMSVNSALGARAGIQDESAGQVGTSRTITGDVRHRIIFGDVARHLGSIMGVFSQQRMWLLLDEWSEIPLDLQPYLADLLRRTVFPVHEIVVKIAAIEQRTNLRIQDDLFGAIGIEIGADAAASLTLDDFMVFDNNATAATSFFKTLLWKHVLASVESESDLANLTEAEFGSQTFTQINALQELVRAAEGVPRDAINIASLAAQSCVDRLISVADIRSAARQWYQQSKESAVSSRRRAMQLLQWVRESVIGTRRARAFLLPSDSKSELIDYLYDSRVIHVIKKGVSSNDTPGIRYNVYAIDYGCYVDLISTTNAPQGLFEVTDAGGASEFVDVPATDYRSIRRAILSLVEFESAVPAN